MKEQKIKQIAESARENTLKAIERSKLSDEISKGKSIPSSDEVFRKALSMSKATSLNKLEKTLAESMLKDLNLTEEEYDKIIKFYG